MCLPKGKIYVKVVSYIKIDDWQSQVLVHKYLFDEIGWFQICNDLCHKGLDLWVHQYPQVSHRSTHKYSQVFSYIMLSLKTQVIKNKNWFRNQKASTEGVSYHGAFHFLAVYVTDWKL